MAPEPSDPVPPLARGDRGHRADHGRSCRPTPLTKRVRRMQHATDTVPAGATAVLVLADGTVFWGRGFGAHTGPAVPGRRSLLQHRHDRLSGDPDRPVLRRPDHHLHLSAYRQRRHQPRGYRGHDHRRPRPGCEAGYHRTVQLAVHPDAADAGCAPRASPAFPASTPGR